MWRAALFLLLLPGCSTIGSITRWPDSKALVYGGARHDVELWDATWDCTGLVRFAIVADVPFSAALDTALLPLTLPIEFVRWLVTPEPSPGP